MTTMLPCDKEKGEADPLSFFNSMTREDMIEMLVTQISMIQRLEGENEILRNKGKRKPKHLAAIWDANAAVVACQRCGQIADVTFGAPAPICPFCEKKLKQKTATIWLTKELKDDRKRTTYTAEPEQHSFWLCDPVGNGSK